MDSHGLDVLFVSSDARPMRGGVARCLDGWLTGLSELGYRAGIVSLVPPALATTRPGPERPYREWLIPTPPRKASPTDVIPPVRKLRTALFALQHHVRTRPRVAAIVRELRPARMVLGFIDRDARFVLGLASQVGAPTAAVCYAAELRPAALVRAPFILRALAESGRVLAISEFTRGLLRALPIRLSDLSVIRPSLAIETERLCREAQENAPPQFGGPSLVTVARLVEGKGIQHTIEAVAILRQGGLDAQLSIVGEGAFEGDLRRQVLNLGLQDNVKFLGGLSDDKMVSVVRRASIFVLTPVEAEAGNVEGFGLVYLEAGALGKPVIGTRTGGVPEAVLNDETGLVVEPASPSQAAEAIVRLTRSESERRRLGAAGRQWAMAHSPRASATILAKALGLNLD